LRDALPRKTLRPARQSRSSNCSRAASIDRRPTCDQHEDRVVADTSGIADVAAVEQPCTSFALIAFGIPVS
jgi:hypothetical protein